MDGTFLAGNISLCFVEFHFAGIGLFFSGNGWGWASFISLRDIKDASKGFLVDDTLIIEAEIPQISIVKPLGPSDEGHALTVS